MSEFVELEPSPEMRAAAQGLLKQYAGVQAFEDGREASRNGESGTPALNQGFMKKYFPPKGEAKDYIEIMTAWTRGFLFENLYGYFCPAEK